MNVIPPSLNHDAIILEICTKSKCWTLSVHSVHPRNLTNGCPQMMLWRPWLDSKHFSKVTFDGSIFGLVYQCEKNERCICCIQ